MAADSPIEWCDDTWGPVAAYDTRTGKRGWFCVHVHRGCTWCYSEAMNLRYNPETNKGVGNGVAFKAQNRQFIRCESVSLGFPRKRSDMRKKHGRRRRIFVNSMFDFMEKAVSDQIRDRIMVAMAINPQHLFMLLSKYPKGLGDYMRAFSWARAVENCRGDDGASVIPRWSINDLERAFGITPRFSYDEDLSVFPLPHLMVGTSPCDQATADASIPDLLRVPAAMRFLSLEPMLGSVDLEPWLAWPQDKDFGCENCDAPCDTCPSDNAVWVDDEKGPRGNDGAPTHLHTYRATLDQVIVGGLSGSGEHPLHPQWVRDVRDQCMISETAFFFKQWGSCLPGAMDGESETGGPAYNIDEEHCGVDYDALGRGREIEAYGTTFIHFGHKKTGRKLDGRTWDEFPKAAA